MAANFKIDMLILDFKDGALDFNAVGVWKREFRRHFNFNAEDERLANHKRHIAALGSHFWIAHGLQLVGFDGLTVGL